MQEKEDKQEIYKWIADNIDRMPLKRLDEMDLKNGDEVVFLDLAFGDINIGVADIDQDAILVYPSFYGKPSEGLGPACEAMLIDEDKGILLSEAISIHDDYHEEEGFEDDFLQELIKESQDLDLYALPDEDEVELKLSIEPGSQAWSDEFARKHYEWAEKIAQAEKEKEEALVQKGRDEVQPLSPNTAHEGLRYNSDKPRLDLLPAESLIHCANVMTKGAKKYKLRNWENGLSWSETTGSLERHLQAFKNGEDYDIESGEYHLAHAAANALMLLQFYKTYPQGDDRNHRYYNQLKIGLDIDEVLCDWVTYWTQHYNQPIPNFWKFDRDLHLKMEEKKNDKAFWLSIPAKINSVDLPFEPALYLTKRPVPNEWTQEWLDNGGFPHVDCVTISPTESKVDTLLRYKAEGKLDVYVDDNYDTFCELNKAGIPCYLMDANHNKKYNVGYRRIYSLKEIS